MNRFTSKILSKILWSATALILLAACASNGIISNINWPKERNVVEGFELGESKRVLSHGLTQISVRALEQPLIGRFVITGITGLADIDPLFSVIDMDDRLQSYVGSTLASDLAKPNDQSVRAWLNLFHGTLVGARRKSDLIGNADLEQIYAAFFDAALDDLDPYSRYAGRLQARINRETRNGFGGIGLRYISTELGLKIQGLQPDAPAEKAGLLVGDIITHVDGISLASNRSWTIRRILRGPIGSTSIFAVIRDGVLPAQHIPIIRSLIVPQTVELTVRDRVAVIEIHSFNQQTSQTVESLLSKALSEDPSIPGIILDLRGDPGGLLDQAVTVSDLFMESGRIVSTRGRHPESIQRYQAFEGDISEGRPIIVLVDSRSASAAEIVAAAIQDSGRGLIVGTSSYGKGTVQTVVRLPNDGELTLTWSRFHAPLGYAIEDLGVLPLVCTSGVDGPIEDTLERWQQTGSQFVARKAEWRTVAPEDVSGRASLRGHCPAEVRTKASIDFELARRLILMDSLYAQAIGLTATSAAEHPP
ncbi:MAG: S41 family peptidase [Rhodospirillaceae bacterium]|nr:S41 family peptidase [Rhodospirillaceae bacterium]